ncbi:hypothetical protein, partial [Shigella sp. SHS-4]|uniref:hypothetical protein n=1 Tax=Shigella sp. SHS-4 TaxID=2116503 RepID=UPI001C0A7B78
LMTFVPATANAAPASVSAPAFWGETQCYHRMRWEQDHFNDGTVGADDWWLKAKHYYLYCAVEGQPDYVILRQSIYSYDFEGANQNCNQLTGINRMGRAFFNSYFHDMVGRNYNPPKVSLKCSGTSTRSVKVYYDDAPRLYTV